MGTDAEDALLFSADRHGEFGRLSVQTGAISIVAGDPLQSGRTLHGIFGRMDVGPVALYRTSGELRLQAERFTLRLVPEMSASLSLHSRVARSLKVMLSDSMSLVIGYTATPRWDSEEQRMVDFTWTEEEDFDYGLLVANVINNKDRFNSFYAD